MATQSGQIRAINQAFLDLPDLQDGFRTVADVLFRMNVEAEKQHRQGSQAPARFSANTAARYFVVKHLLDGLADPDRFTVDDILNIRNEVLWAQAYAKKFREQLASWAQAWRAQIVEIDYAELMKAE